MISLFGVVAGFLVHMLAAAAGLTTLFLAIPFAFEVLKWMGAAYLLYLAWQAAKPGARSPFEAGPLPDDPPHRLFLMGFITNLLNPKIAFFYLSIFPQFVKPEHGSVFAQSLQLGFTHVAASVSVNLTIALSAATFAAWVAQRPGWLTVQRYFMGTVLATLAIKMALEPRRSV